MSTTVTCWVHVAVKPEPSVTVQVTVVSPNGNVTGASFDTSATLQLSEVVGTPNATVASQFAAASTFSISEGQVIVGGVVSAIMTCCVWVSVLPLPSS